jgi:hypothetical protein
MQDLDRYLNLTRRLRAEFDDLGAEKRPGEAFSALLAELPELPDTVQVDLLRRILINTTDKTNLAYLRRLVRETAEILRLRAFFLIEELNTALDILLAAGDVRYGLRLLGLCRHGADYRTIAVLHRYAGLYRERAVVARLVAARSEIQRRLRPCLKAIEGLSLEPPITFFDHWQE